MKEFFKKIFRLLLCLPVICVALVGVSIADNNHFFGRLPGDEVYNAIEFSDKNSGYKKVVLGDSVAKQLFVPGTAYKDEYYSLAANRVIGLAGQYLLLKNYLENNPQTEEVVIMLLPSSVQQDFNDKLTYSYFVLPFFQYYRYFMTERSFKVIEDNYGIFSNSEVLFMMTRSALLRNLYQTYVMDVSDMESTDSWKEYMVKIQEMCDEKGINVKWRSSPLSNTEESHQKEETLIKNCGETEMAILTDDYFNSIKYYDEKNMRDGIHFYDDYVSTNRDKIIADVLGD
ncbi:MAG: hypothetical protein ACI4I6_10740 [Hominimerdicola sp.]